MFIESSEFEFEVYILLGTSDQSQLLHLIKIN